VGTPTGVVPCSGLLPLFDAPHSRRTPNAGRVVRKQANTTGDIPGTQRLAYPARYDTCEDRPRNVPGKARTCKARAIDARDSGNPLIRCGHHRCGFSRSFYPSRGKVGGMAQAEQNVTERVMIRLEEPLKTVMAALGGVVKTEDEYNVLARAVIEYGTACVAITAEEVYAEANAAFDV